MKSEYYCLDCTQTVEIDSVTIAPNSFVITCPNCGSKWRVEIEFYEYEDDV